MGIMEHVDSMTVVGTRLPIENRSPLDFSSGYYDGYGNVSDQYRYDVSPEWYHALNDHMDYMSYCEYISTPIDVEDLLDKNDNVKSLSEEEAKARKDVIKDHLDKQKKQLAGIEENDQWKFLSEPEKYPFEQEIIISGRRIKKVYKTPQARDSLLDGYNENSYQECFNNNYKYLDGDEGDLDRAAKENIIFMKYLHNSITNSIEINTKNLNKLEFAQSSVLAIPSPNIPTLSYGVGSNSQVTQTANGNIAKGFENKLGAIRDGLAETFDCSFGMSCSNDMDKAAKNPNVGKELTAEEKEVLGILGGSVSVSPNGLEPDDEEPKNNQQQRQNENNFKNFTDEDLISSANKPINKQGLSAAARAWDKHATRPDGVFEPLKGNPAQKNAAAENFIREILKDSKAVRSDLSGGAFEYRLPSGKGIRYNADGSFNTMLDPKKAIK